MKEKSYGYRPKSKLVELPTNVKIPSSSSDLIVITKTKNLVRYIFQITKSSPKKFRLTFVNKLQNLGLEIIEDMYRANDLLFSKANTKNYEKRYAYQSRALTNLKILEYFALLSLENECILLKHYEQIAKQGSECIILLANWIKSDKARIQ